MAYTGFDLYNRLSTICRENGTTISAFLISLGKSQSAGTYMKTKKNVDKDIVEKASVHFGVTPEWLMGASDVRNADTATRIYSLDERESAIIDGLRRADPPMRSAICRMVDAALSAPLHSSTSASASFLTLHDDKIRHLRTQKTCARGMKRVVGDAAAGRPIAAVPQDDLLVSVPAKYLSDNYFIVHACGDSMIGVNVNDGDYCVFQKDAYMDDGQVMLVQISGLDDGSQVTIKRVFRRDDQVELRSANPDYPPMFYPASDVRLLGVLVLIVTPD